MASMAFGFVLSIFLLVVAFRVKSATAKCDPGWFGPDCVYQCHCKNRNVWACDQNRGRCTSPSQCEEGFAGTACQYVDLAYKLPPTGDLSPTGQGSLQELTDGDTGTCFGIPRKENGSTSAIQLKEPSWIHTISILLENKTARAEELEVSILGDKDTHVAARPHLSKPTDVRYNYHLPRPVRGSRVQIRTLSNETALSLCDVNVLGGRNVALKKSARQGEATYKDGAASRAVDGNRNDDFDQRSCSHTDDVLSGNAVRSWWRVSLANQQHIWRVKVYNRAGINANRLGGFIVNVTYSNGSSSEVYRNPDTTPPAVVDVMLPNITNPDPIEGTELTIWHSGVGKMLTLCEVEVFGDCLRGYFGWQCESECWCENPNEVCDTLWGECPVSGCKAGWRGDGCLQECFNGTFGYGCKSHCSATCMDDKCHHVTGECTNGCAPGWQGEYCNNKCSATMFGQNCSEACLPGCLKKQCHHVTGECTGGCGAGWTGNNCTETCIPGFHGVNCSVPCSENCLNTTCDATSGDCTHGCVAGTSCETSKVTGDEKTRDEAAADVVTTAQPTRHHDVTCLDNRMSFSIPFPGNLPRAATLSDPRCHVDTAGGNLMGSINLNSCGTTVAFTNDSVIFRNVITITSADNSTGEEGLIPIQCKYDRFATVQLSYMPVVRHVLFTEVGIGQLSFRIQQFRDASYLTAVADSQYPLRMEPNERVYIQLSLGDVLSAGHKDDIGINVQECVASPFSTLLQAQSNSVPLIQESCPASNDVQLMAIYPEDIQRVRFSFKVVSFPDLQNQLGDIGLVFVHCRVSVCPADECSASNRTCPDPSAIRRVRRSAHDSVSTHQLSTGPFLVSEDKGGAVSSTTALAAVSMVVAAIATVVAMVAVVAWRRSRREAIGQKC